MRDDDDMGPGPRPIEDFDPPEATLVVVSPQEGATFTTTAGSLELAVEVEVSYWNPTGSTIPGSVSLRFGRVGVVIRHAPRAAT